MENLESLSKLFEHEQPKVLVVVGAGVSIGATGLPHASWFGLLEHGIKHLVNTDTFTATHGEKLSKSLENAFNPFNLDLALLHAENIEISLNTPDSQAYAEWLKVAFEKFSAHPSRLSTLKAIGLLQQSGALLVTTNYDSLLSDVTGLPQVTWEEHTEFLQVLNRKREGILHIHGHWLQPSSIVLGRSSYEKVVQDKLFQDAFKSLWMEWTWIYVGCGDGLSDPNLGRLLEWSKQWGQGGLTHYFFALNNTAIDMSSRSDKPVNLTCIGFQDYAELPNLLTEITSLTKCAPYLIIDENFPTFRAKSSKPSENPFPSMEEYVNGDVPALDADALVMERLIKHNWAYVLDLASVGKTTLALRLATKDKKQNLSVFYLDLASLDYDSFEIESDILSLRIFKRIARLGRFFILDNIHHQPKLARLIWEQWRAFGRGSWLLLIGTVIQRAAIISPEEDNEYFKSFSANPPIALKPTIQDLGRIVESIHKRFSKNQLHTPLQPPEQYLNQWHLTFSGALSAFSLAVLGRLHRFAQGDWSLPAEAAADWVREKWLEKLNDHSIQNLLCLAVLSTQELELAVPKEALPYPEETSKLLRLGLVARQDSGVFGENKRFNLREPGWGTLIIAAQNNPIDQEAILLTTIERHLPVATTLLLRFRAENNMHKYDKIMQRLAVDIVNTAQLSKNLSLENFLTFVKEVKRAKQDNLFDECFNAIERDPVYFNSIIFEYHLQLITHFFNTIKRTNRNPQLLWPVIAENSKKIVLKMWDTPLDTVSIFLKSSKMRGHSTSIFWDTLESDSEKLSALILDSTLDIIGHFFNEANKQGRNIDYYWCIIENNLDAFVSLAWKTKFFGINTFIKYARFQKRDVSVLLEYLNKSSTWIIDNISSFNIKDLLELLKNSKTININKVTIWRQLEANKNEVASYFLTASVGQIVWLLETAKQDKQNFVTLRTMIPSKELTTRLLSSSLNDCNLLLKFCINEKIDNHSYWSALTRTPKLVTDAMLCAKFEDLEEFLMYCFSYYDLRKLTETKAHSNFLNIKNDTRLVFKLWESLRIESFGLKNGFSTQSLKGITTLLDSVAYMKLDIHAFWGVVLRDPLTFISLMHNENDIFTFLKLSKTKNLDLTPILQYIEIYCRTITKQIVAFKLPISILSNCLYILKIKNRNLLNFWQVFLQEYEVESKSTSSWLTSIDSTLVIFKIASTYHLDVELVWKHFYQYGGDLIATEVNSRKVIISLRTLLKQSILFNKDCLPIWQMITSNIHGVSSNLTELLLDDIRIFLHELQENEFPAELLWENLDFNKIADRMRISSLLHRVKFLDEVFESAYDAKTLWLALGTRSHIQLEARLQAQNFNSQHPLQTIIQGAVSFQELTQNIANKSTLTPHVLICPLATLVEYDGLAKEMQIDFEPVWEVLALNPVNFIERSAISTLKNVSNLLRSVNKYSKCLSILWESLDTSNQWLIRLMAKANLDDLAGFLKVLHTLKIDVRPLWHQFQKDLPLRETQAWNTKLSTLTAILRALEKAGIDGSTWWNKLSHDAESLLTCVLNEPLHVLTDFLKASITHDIDTTEFWLHLYQKPGFVAGMLWTSPNHMLSQFLLVLSQQNYPSDQIWKFFIQNSERWNELAARTPLLDLSKIFTTTNEFVARDLLNLLDDEFWQLLESDSKGRMVGATSFAVKCIEFGKVDLHNKLISIIFKRSNHYDFPFHAGLSNVAWFLKTVDPQQAIHVPLFLKQLLSDNWLEVQYIRGMTGSLASALRIIAITQPLEIKSLFLINDLTTRIQLEFNKFLESKPKQQCLAIQLLGCAVECGWDANKYRNIFHASKVLSREIARLPTELVVHKDQANLVEDIPLQLWLGLHAWVTITGEKLNVPSEVIQKTLQLWRINLNQSSNENNHFLTNLDKKMVLWLENCLENGSDLNESLNLCYLKS